MQYQYDPYVWPLIASSLLSLLLGIYALIRYRNVKGAISFMLCMLVSAIWSGGNALEMSSMDLNTKLFWANMQYFAYCYSPVTLLALCMQFTGFDKWIQNKKILLVAIIPTIIIVLVWTDTLHGLIRYDIQMDYNGNFPVISKKYGPVFFIHGAYSHFFNIATWFLLIRAAFLKNTVNRKQVIALLIGTSMIIIPNILYITGFSPIKRFDITPVFLGPVGLIMIWSIFRFKMFDLVPLARTTVIETMDAGVMVLDLKERVLDINPAFEKIIGLSAAKIITRRAEEVCCNIPELARACSDSNINHSEFTINIKETLMTYEVLLTPLTDTKGIPIGRLIVIYDITEKKREQQEYLKQQWTLAVIEERERMTRDMHDNLGQVLGFINLQVQGVKQELINEGIENIPNKLDKVANIAQSAHAEIRDYIRNIRSEVYIEKDFITALKKDILCFEEQTGINVKLDIPDEFTGEALKPNIRLNILYVVKEALNNVRKHAEADNVRVSFLIAQEQLCTIVEDDGKGFDTRANSNFTKSKFGMDIMRERVSEIGGLLDIKSVEGKGSKILFYLPIKEEKKNEVDVG